MPWPTLGPDQSSSVSLIRCGAVDQFAVGMRKPNVSRRIDQQPQVDAPESIVCKAMIHRSFPAAKYPSIKLSAHVRRWQSSDSRDRHLLGPESDERDLHHLRVVHDRRRLRTQRGPGKVDVLVPPGRHLFRHPQPPDPRDSPTPTMSPHGAALGTVSRNMVLTELLRVPRTRAARGS